MEAVYAAGLANKRPVPPSPTPGESLKIQSTGRALGAEVTGIDLSQPISSEVRQILREAWHHHLVLLFRDQYLTAAQYRDAAAIFGQPQEGANRRYIRAAGQSVDNDLPEVSVLSNLNERGLPTRVNSGLGSLEVVWHSDNSYIEAPPAGSCLYALEVPTHSGNTAFANQYLAYDTLPRDLLATIQGLRAKHDASRNSAGVVRPGLKKPERPEDVPGPLHPLVIVHPETGRKTLYLGRRRIYPSQFIDGLSAAESEALLDRLWAHATQEKFTWTHRWRVGDLLVWDNRCLLHHREPVDESQRRVMLRTQFEGQVPVAG